MMRGLWHVALHDLRLHLAERANVFFLLLMPMGFVFFFAMVNRDTGPEDVTVSLPVVDRDGGFLAVAFVEQLRGENFDTRVYTADEADRTEFETRYVEIPDRFTARVLAGDPTKVVLHARATSSASYDLAAKVRLHRAQVRFLGNLVRWAQTHAVGDTIRELPATLAGLDAAERGRLLALVAEPPAVEVVSEFAGRGRPVPSGTRQSIPGVVVMFVVMTVLIGGTEALTREKVEGTLRRLATTPLSREQILAGKTLGLTLLGLTQTLILVVVTEACARLGWLGLDFLWSPHWVGLLPLAIAYCACVASLGILLGGLFRTPQQAESLAWLVGMVLSGLGGAWWPLEIVPSTMQKVGLLLPPAWAMRGLHGLITFGQGASAVVVPVLVLLTMAALFGWIGARTLRVEG